MAAKSATIVCCLSVLAACGSSDASGAFDAGGAASGGSGAGEGSGGAGGEPLDSGAPTGGATAGGTGGVAGNPSVDAAAGAAGTAGVMVDAAGGTPSTGGAAGAFSGGTGGVAASGGAAGVGGATGGTGGIAGTGGTGGTGGVSGTGGSGATGAVGGDQPVASFALAPASTCFDVEIRPTECTEPVLSWSLQNTTCEISGNDVRIRSDVCEVCDLDQTTEELSSVDFKFTDCGHCDQRYRYGATASAVGGLDGSYDAGQCRDDRIDIDISNTNVSTTCFDIHFQVRKAPIAGGLSDGTTIIGCRCDRTTETCIVCRDGACL